MPSQIFESRRTHSTTRIWPTKPRLVHLFLNYDVKVQDIPLMTLTLIHSPTNIKTFEIFRIN